MTVTPHVRAERRTPEWAIPPRGSGDTTTNGAHVQVTVTWTATR